MQGERGKGKGGQANVQEGAIRPREGKPSFRRKAASEGERETFFLRRFFFFLVFVVATSLG